MFTKLIHIIHFNNNSHKWTFRLTEESLRSYHWLQNTKTDLFIEILPSRRNLLEFTDHWILYDPIQNKYFKYDHLHVNAINEWNPMKLGDNNYQIALKIQHRLLHFISFHLYFGILRLCRKKCISKVQILASLFYLI